MKKNFSKAIITFCSMAFFSPELIAQCNSNSSFVKKKCFPKILPFTASGQMNAIKLSEGQSTEVMLTFSAGQNYRILVCSEEILGEVAFRVKDMYKKIVFDSRNNDYPDFWDFKMQSTQQFTIEISAPLSDSPSSTPPSGCVTVIVGFK